MKFRKKKSQAPYTSYPPTKKQISAGMSWLLTVSSLKPDSFNHILLFGKVPPIPRLYFLGAGNKPVYYQLLF